MTRHTVDADGHLYTITLDDTPPQDARIWAVVSVRLMDEITNTPVRSLINISSDNAGLIPRVATDGLAGMVGIPMNVFPALNNQNYALDVAIEADGYLSRHETATIAKDRRAIAAPAPAIGDFTIRLNSSAGLHVGQTLLLSPASPNLERMTIQLLGPGVNEVTLTAAMTRLHMALDPVVVDDFVPADLGDVAMHREPVMIQGRTLLASGSTTSPLTGVAIKLARVCWSLPPTGSPFVLRSPNLVAVQPPLYFPRTAATGILRQREMTVTADPPKSLLEHAATSDTQLRLSNRIGLGVGEILWIDATDPDRMEYIAISTIVGAGSADQPTTITMACPLAYDHRRNAVIRRVVRQSIGIDKSFQRDAIGGDACVFLTDVTGLSAVSVVEVVGGPSLSEYHRLRMFETASDADGYFRLPPLSRVAQVEIQAEIRPPAPPIPTTLQLKFNLDYSQPENQIDLVFRLP